MPNNKQKLRWIYVCPRPGCGNVVFKSEKLDETVARIKCQKCGKVSDFDKLRAKRLSP